MNKLKLIFTLLIMILGVSFVAAQDDPPPNDFVDNDRPPRQNRFLMLARELELTDEQILQWRQINRQGRLQNRDVQQRLREAKEDLDKLIYSDTVNEVELQTKLRAVVEAQAEVTKNRTRTEFAVRNILTPQQLVKFRNLRKRFKKQQRERQRMQQQRRQRRQRMNRNDRNPNLRDGPPRRNRRRP